MKEPIISVKPNVQEIAVRLRIHPARMWWQAVRISIGASIIALGARLAGTRIDLQIEQQVREEPTP